MKFNYQSIGSGGGIKQITAKTVDFGASDAILNEEQSTAAPGLQMFPTVAGAEALVVNLKDADGNAITAPIKFPYTSVADIFLGKIKKWNDPVLTRGKSRYQAARSGHHRGPSFRRLRHHLHLHRLPLQGQPGMEGKGRQCQPRCNGRWDWAARATKVSMAPSRRTTAPSDTSSWPTPLQNKAVINTVQNKAGSVRGTFARIDAVRHERLRQRPGRQAGHLDHGWHRREHPIRSPATPTCCSTWTSRIAPRRRSWSTS